MMHERAEKSKKGGMCLRFRLVLCRPALSYPFPSKPIRTGPTHAVASRSRPCLPAASRAYALGLIIPKNEGY
jgi:hypothetical protein